MHNGVDQSGGGCHAQEHTHESAHVHLHTHTGEHAHQHEGLSPETVHTHAHTHMLTHEHDCADASETKHRHGAEVVADRAEIAALLNYTLQHNHHLNAELQEMQVQLRVLGLDNAAERIGMGISDFAAGNAHLADALKRMKE